VQWICAGKHNIVSAFGHCNRESHRMGRVLAEGTFNHLVYTQIMHELPVVVLGCVTYVTMGSCAARQANFFDSKRRVVTPWLAKPAIYVHQYNRYNVVDREWSDD
jgi:hypothetical protein